MVDKLWFLIPEMIVFTGAVLATVVGLSKRKMMRDATGVIAVVALLAALVVTPMLYADAGRIEDAGLLLGNLGKYVKMVVCGIGVMLIMVNAGLVDRKLEREVAAGRSVFDPISATRGEFFAFALLSLTGLMLCCNANDLIWLFLALELTSLPTYVMVAISRGSRLAQEAAVKYFFLGALAAAVFLLGFAFLYGASGTIVLTEMKTKFATQAAYGDLNPFAIVGMILSILGICFKIAAAPLHFYAPDVYEGAAAPVSAFLAFVPKFAGMLALILLLTTVGWEDHFGNFERGLPAPIQVTLWIVAVLTMTLGNVGALLQKSVKRILAYSSIAHSGYMLIGLIAGPGLGISAMLFYMLAYGLMNTAAFAVLAGLERQGQELETLDDLAGLRVRHPWMAAVMAVAALSLVGLPPLLGFWGKLYLFIAGVQADHIILVVIAGLNSAISAWYYLGLVKCPVLDQPSARAETVERGPSRWPRVAAIVTAASLIIVPIFTRGLLKATDDAVVAGGDAINQPIIAGN